VKEETERKISALLLKIDFLEDELQLLREEAEQIGESNKPSFITRLVGIGKMKKRN